MKRIIERKSKTLTTFNPSLYLANLERDIQSAFAISIFSLLVGVTLNSFGMRYILNACMAASAEIFILTGLTSTALYKALVLTVQKFPTIGQLHVWLDKWFFGIMKRVNEIIFQSLLTVLEPRERQLAANLEPMKQDNVVKNVFSKLSNDTELLAKIKQSGLFQNWTWYWVMVYGTITFSVLTIVTFVVILSGVEYEKIVFIAFWLPSLLFLSTTLLLGVRLKRLSKRVVRQMICSHRFVIHTVLKENISVG